MTDTMDIVRSVAAKDPEFYGAFRRANSSDPRTAARGAVEMSVLTIREGATHPDYLVAPAHLPVTDQEMQLLLTSQVKADAPLRSDLVAWADENRRRQDRAAKALENLVAALRGVDGILDNPDETDEELMAWADEISLYVSGIFDVNVRAAPRAKPELEAWCWEAAGTHQTTPRWLIEHQQPSTFAPRARGPRSTAAVFGPPANDEGDD
jgi:hypothetical protein